VKKYNTAVVGATGLVGSEMIKVLVQRNFPVSQWRLFASSNSAGTTVDVNGEAIVVEDVAKADFAGVEVALFAGGEIASADYAPKFVEAGAVVIDNSAVFRMEPEVPLVVPEVNPHHLEKHKGIIANPNCSTIQMIAALKPIYDAVGIRRLVISTYQSVSGTGKAAVEELREQAALTLNNETDKIKPSVYPHTIGFNLLPHIGSFQNDGYTSEEHKMIFETRKMLDEPTLAITATTVRVPTFTGHCESLNIETKKKTTPEAVRELLEKAPGIKVVDDPAKNLYPHTIMAAGTDDVFVGRIRQDLSCENGIEMFIAADNLRKGAALNAVQIAEKMIEMNLL
jgi:aspartate-semialdehyde dehydrogenase